MSVLITTLEVDMINIPIFQLRKLKEKKIGSLLKIPQLVEPGMSLSYRYQGYISEKDILY